MSRSPSWRFLMNPAGLPFLAGRTVTLRFSPGLMEVLLIPRRVSTWREAVVSTQSVTVPSLFGTVSSMLGVWIREVQLLEPALQDDLLVEVVHPRHGMMGLQGAASERDTDRQESAQYKKSSASCAHGCYSNSLFAAE